MGGLLKPKTPKMPPPPKVDMPKPPVPPPPLRMPTMMDQTVQNARRRTYAAQRKYSGGYPSTILTDESLG